MDTDCFVYAPVLNFLQYNNGKGVEATVILKFAVEFFESSDIAKSKKILWDLLPKLTEPYPRHMGFKCSSGSFERHVRTSSKSECF